MPAPQKHYGLTSTPHTVYNTCHGLVDTFGRFGIQLEPQLLNEIRNDLTYDETLQLKTELTNSIFNIITETLQSKKQKITHFDIL